ncbi:hypothetical protein BB561_000705 [Smittium simulii]|uniref:Uncharacterized protein n=1 Tax=Smittium simulii TaxID=133385 RepID=A0A2T9YXX8_9FUNG|nr:hypothetical protein BB561_000705 [Smittium simulii]
MIENKISWDYIQNFHNNPATWPSRVLERICSSLPSSSDKLQFSLVHSNWYTIGQEVLWRFPNFPSEPALKLFLTLVKVKRSKLRNVRGLILANSLEHYSSKNLSPLEAKLIGRSKSFKSHALDFSFKSLKTDPQILKFLLHATNNLLKLCFYGCSLTDSNLIELIQFNSHIRCLEIVGAPPNQEQLATYFRSFKDLTHLSLSFGSSINPNVWKALGKCSANLCTLNIYADNISSEIESFLISTKNLTKLSIIGENNFISDELIAIVAQNNPKLSSLSIESTSITTYSLSNILNYCLRLTNLELVCSKKSKSISHNLISSINTRTLYSLVLKNLDLSTECYSVIFFNNPMLSLINISGSSSLIDANLSQLSNSSIFLEGVIIEDCPNISNNFFSGFSKIHSMHLKVFKVINCNVSLTPKLYETLQDFAYIEHLDITGHQIIKKSFSISLNSKFDSKKPSTIENFFLDTNIDESIYNLDEFKSSTINTETSTDSKIKTNSEILSNTVIIDQDHLSGNTTSYNKSSQNLTSNHKPQTLDAANTIDSKTVNTFSLFQSNNGADVKINTPLYNKYNKSDNDFKLIPNENTTDSGSNRNSQHTVEIDLYNENELTPVINEPLSFGSESQKSPEVESYLTKDEINHKNTLHNISDKKFEILSRTSIDNSKFSDFQNNSLKLLQNSSVNSLIDLQKLKSINLDLSEDLKILNNDKFNKIYGNSEDNTVKNVILVDSDEDSNNEDLYVCQNTNDLVNCDLNELGIELKNKNNFGDNYLLKKLDRFSEYNQTENDDEHRIGNNKKEQNLYSNIKNSKTDENMNKNDNSFTLVSSFDINNSDISTDSCKANWSVKNVFNDQSSIIEKDIWEDEISFFKPRSNDKIGNTIVHPETDNITPLSPTAAEEIPRVLSNRIDLFNSFTFKKNNSKQAINNFDEKLAQEIQHKPHSNKTPANISSGEENVIKPSIAHKQYDTNDDNQQYVNFTNQNSSSQRTERIRSPNQNYESNLFNPTQNDALAALSELINNKHYKAKIINEKNQHNAYDYSVNSAKKRNSQNELIRISPTEKSKNGFNFNKSESPIYSEQLSEHTRKLSTIINNKDITVQPKSQLDLALDNKPILELKVETPTHGQQKLVLYRNEDPSAVSEKFCKTYGMPELASGLKTLSKKANYTTLTLNLNSKNQNKVSIKHLLDGSEPQSLKKICFGGSDKKIGCGWSQFIEDIDADIEYVPSFIGDIYVSIQHDELVEDNMTGGFERIPRREIAIKVSEINFRGNYIYPSSPVARKMVGYAVDFNVNI